MGDAGMVQDVSAKSGWRCRKDPTEVSKINHWANETLLDFKERWTEEMGYIRGVPE
ncbi:hypothetical protein Tco_0354471, partial [Tanacetum coccineum]